MSEDPDKQQEELQRMLAMKRREAPPPRFFNGFSDRVLDRLNAPEPPEPETLWHRLGLSGDGRPVLVCASGVLVCGLLVFGLIASLRVGPTQSAPQPPEDLSHFILTPISPAPPAPGELAPALGLKQAASLSEPVVVPSASPTLFNTPPPPSVQQAAVKGENGKK